MNARRNRRRINSNSTITTLASDLQTVSGPWTISVAGDVIMMRRIGLMPPIKTVTISLITEENAKTLDHLNNVNRLTNYSEFIGNDFHGMDLTKRIGEYFLSPVEYTWFVQNSIYIASRNPTLRHSCSMRDVRSMYSAIKNSAIRPLICNYDTRYFANVNNSNLNTNLANTIVTSWRI